MLKTGPIRTEHDLVPNVSFQLEKINIILQLYTSLLLEITQPRVSAKMKGTFELDTNLIHASCNDNESCYHIESLE